MSADSPSCWLRMRASCARRPGRRSRREVADQRTQVWTPQQAGAAPSAPPRQSPLLAMASRRGPCGLRFIPRLGEQERCQRNGTCLAAPEAMRYLALACDYDGTIGHDGVVSEETLSALRFLRSSGRRLLLVTGRRLDDMKRLLPSLELFDRVVVENGALLYRPGHARGGARWRSRHRRRSSRRCGRAASRRSRWAGPSSPPGSRTSTAVLETIRELGLELQVIFNKGAVMVLPSGVEQGHRAARGAAGAAAVGAQRGRHRRRRERPRVPLGVRVRRRGGERAARC